MGAEPPGDPVDQLRLRLGTKSLGLTTRDLPLLVLMALMGVGFYLAFTRLTAGQEQTLLNQREGFHKLEQLLATFHGSQTVLLEQIRLNRDEMGSLVAQQNGVLRDQTTAMYGLMKEQTAGLHADMLELMCRLAVLSYNQGRDPSEHLPLELSPPRESR
jgi:hypothetical protein